IPTTKKGGLSADINNKWRKVRKILTQLCQIQAFQIYNHYIEIFNYIEKIFDKVTKQEDVVFLSEINKKVKQVVSLKEKFVPQLYIRLATRIQQCLIDEFQDTSVIQWENILPIVEEVLASGGMLFYVGDKKQSIYRFRGSDHQLFDEVVIKYFPQYRYEKDTLKINRRSKKVIVDFNNKIFSDENLEKLLDYLEEETGFMLKDEVLKIYSNSQQQPQEENTEGYIYGELVDIKINDYEEYVKQKVVKILSMIKNAESILPEVAVLVRDNKEVMKVSNWLLENNFAVESEKTLNIQENEFVKEIISLLKFLSTPFDNLSFASFILGETFILSCGISYEEIQKLVFEWSKNKKVYLYQYFQEIYPQVWNKYFSPIFEQSKFLPVYDLLIKIYSVFNFNSNYHFHNNYSFFYHLLKLAKKFEEENSSLQFFIEKFDSLLEEEKYVVAKGENLIKVMTIHKAKGLEFDIVILPFVELIVDVGRQKDTTSRFVIDTFNDNLYLVKLNQTMLNYYEKIKQLYEREYRKILIDELNVLYVSFTRAKRQIYFFVPDEKKNIAKFLFPWNGNNIIEVGIFDKDLQDKKNTTDNLPKYLPPLNHKDCSDILVEQKVDINEIVNKNKIIEGEIIHKIFSYIANLEGKNVNLEIDIAIKKTKSLFYFVPEEKWNRYKYLVNKIVFNKNFRKLFFVKDGYVFCEYEIVSSSGETKRVDRVLFYNDKLTIVEYKLHIHDEIENYKNQTEEYKQILLEIFKKPIEGYILFIDKMKLVKV
ncbi:MAG: UvrD-helicase domain-containing protein, partial [Endomicrobia bacterium]|nr:UvrD-helicase domain-containing protein [Endomicrobiia bacterium]